MEVWLIILSGCAVLMCVIAFFLIKEIKQLRYNAPAAGQTDAADGLIREEPQEEAAAHVSPGRRIQSPAAPTETAQAAPDARENTPPMPIPPIPDKPQTFDLPETIPAFQEKRCCICDRELGIRHAVLFRLDSGAEARIDYDCAHRLNTVVKDPERREIAAAGHYIMSRLDDVDPLVAAYLKKYVKAAAERLRE